MNQSPRLPRKAVLTPNLHHGRQDLCNLESRTSTDHRSKESEEQKIQSVQPRVEGFDPQDGEKQSTSSYARSIPTYNAQNVHYIVETGIVCCTCGKCLHRSERNLQLNKERCDVWSIPKFVIKIYPMELDTDQLKGSESNAKPTHAQKRPGRKSATPYWKDSKKKSLYRDPLTKIGWDENVILAYGEIAKDDQSYNATRGERNRNENSSKLKFKTKAAHGPLDQRDDYKEAKETCKKLYKEHAASAGCGNLPIHPQQQVRRMVQPAVRRLRRGLVST